MMKMKYLRLPRRRVGLVALPVLLMAGVATLWATFPSGVTTVTLSEPLSPSSCKAETSSTTDPDCQYSSARYDGCLAGGGSGMTVLSADLDNDGYLDIAVGQPQADSGKGKVYVVYGSATEPASTVSLCTSSSAQIAISGAASNDNLGAALAAADLQGGDGKVDLAIGAPGRSTSTGAVYVLKGGSRWSSGTVTSFSNLVTVSGAASSDKLGSSLATGDFTYDSKADLLAGAPGGARAYLVFGPVATGTVSEYSACGTTTCSAVYDVTFKGASGDSTGVAVANAGDLENDGILDMAIGASQASSSQGAAYLIRGKTAQNWYNYPTANLTAYGSYSGIVAILGDLTVGAGATKVGQLGAAVAGVGDVDNDGFGDVALGAPTAPRVAGSSATYLESGRVYIYFGGSGVLNQGSKNLSTLNSFFYGNTAYDHLGSALSAAGNVDNDNFGDFLAGAPDADATNSNPGSTYGAAYLVQGRSESSWPGATGSTLGQNIKDSPNVEFYGRNTADTAGKPLFGASSLDFDSDGYDDFFIGAAGYDVSSSNAEGRIYFQSFGDFYDQDADNQSKANGDCEEEDGDIYYSSSGNNEVCDGKDNDCDGLTDDADSVVADPTTYYYDSDGDGYGNSLQPQTACDHTTGYVATSGDCDDTNAAINPAATEICDSKDNDCDGASDDSDSSVTDQKTYYKDNDGDTYGNSSGGTKNTCASTPPTGYSKTTDDCDDTNAAINPGAQEMCDSKDNDCDSKIDDADSSVTGQHTYYTDSDQDGYGNSASTTLTCASTPPTGKTSISGDCEDDDPDINPGAAEVCDGIDNDCDDYVDYFDSSLSGDTLYYSDDDTDGYGDRTESGVQGCASVTPSGKVKDHTDCNDADKAINPAAVEKCDSKDNDCDDKIDDADSSVTGQSTYYKDNDSDAYGASSSGMLTTCTTPAPGGYSSQGGDCNDASAAINPAAEEVCDGVDNDCDSLTDDQDSPVSGQTAYYQDADGDGHGDADSPVYDCDNVPPAGSVTNSDDCNDGSATVYPGASEGQGTSAEYYGCLQPDSVDNDCDGTIDEGTCSKDDDGDGYTDYQGDCNDGDPSIHKNAVELCDGIDQDCDGSSTNGYDADSDGFLSAAKCTGSPKGTDCNDTDSTIYPNAPELCDGKDNDCDASTDEDFDQDGDTYLSKATCTDPVRATDCDDSDATVNPGSTEVCDGVDQDCDGEKDNGFDADDDKYLSIETCGGYSGATDCNDFDPNINPGVLEVCDGIDNNCSGNDGSDGIADELQDNDDDGYAVCNSKDPTRQDCDDTNDAIYPTADEQCDGLDNDCDKVVPEDENDADEDGVRVCEQDCDDANADEYPGLEEVCDGLDNDCDGLVDNDASDAIEYFVDADGDGSGDPAMPVYNCELYDGIVDNADDCNDRDDTIYEDATELCDGKDNDCDGTPDSELLEFDRDEDGYLDRAQCAPLADSIQLDCDDSNGSINPGVTEVPGDGIDNNCDDLLVPAADGSGSVTVFEDSSLSCSVAASGDVGGERRSSSLFWWLMMAPLGLAWRRHRRRSL